MQSKQEIETWYQRHDPWQYENNPDDIHRKEIILNHLGKYNRALDIGAGEGWITKDLPADHIEAIEWSDTAAQRFPKNITRVMEPTGQYDLIIATGVFYPQYDWKQMHEWIYHHATDTVLTSNIKSWEIPLEWEPVKVVEYPYREYTQRLCIYKL